MRYRRGLSSIIGMIFLVVILSSVIGYFTYAINLVEQVNDELIMKGIESFDKLRENFEITNIRIDGSKFNLTVQNTGELPINFTRLWVNNVTDSAWKIQNFTVNKVSSPGQVLYNIGQNLNLYALESQSYSLRLVTERGNLFNVQVSSPQDKALMMSLFTTPANPLSNQNVTLLYVIKNNLTDGSIIPSLTPQMDPPTVTGSATAIQQGTVTPASVEGLKPSETAIFEWTYLVTGDNDDKITFNATVANAAQGNYVIDTSIIDIAPVAEDAINQALSGSFGILTMDFSSFENCIPDDPIDEDCRPNSADWVRAWDASINSYYLWRVNVTNNGQEPIMVEENTALLFIPALAGGGASNPVPYFIRANSIASNENPGQYVDYSTIIDPDEEEEMYFGTKTVGSGDLEKTHGSTAIVAVFMLIFGVEDIDDSGTKTSGDTPYSQNLPFQAYKID